MCPQRLHADGCLEQAANPRGLDLTRKGGKRGEELREQLLHSCFKPLGMPSELVCAGNEGTAPRTIKAPVKKVAQSWLPGDFPSHEAGGSNRSRKVVSLFILKGP